MERKTHKKVMYDILQKVREDSMRLPPTISVEKISTRVAQTLQPTLENLYLIEPLLDMGMRALNAEGKKKL